jgi:hypothetical protein
MALTLSKNTDCTQLIAVQTLINSGVAETGTIGLTVYKNCCDCTGYPVTVVKDGANLPINVVNKYGISGTTITLEPGILGTGITKFPDGVYKVVITVTKDADGDGVDEVTTESNCFFMDCSTSCEVAKYIKNLLKTPADVEAHLLHFGLVNGSNCNCNCDEMCSLYTKLYNILNNTEACLCNCT